MKDFFYLETGDGVGDGCFNLHGWRVCSSSSTQEVSHLLAAAISGYVIPFPMANKLVSG